MTDKRSCVNHALALDVELIGGEPMVAEPQGAAHYTAIMKTAKVLAAASCSGPVFRADALQMLRKELDLLGSDYVTRAEIFETLDLDACGEVWPMVTEISPMAGVQALHEQIEQGAVAGRAALLIGS